MCIRLLYLSLSVPSMKSCQIFFFFFLLIKSVEVFLGWALASSGLPRSADEAGFGHLTAVRLPQTGTRSTRAEASPPVPDVCGSVPAWMLRSRLILASLLTLLTPLMS